MFTLKPTRAGHRRKILQHIKDQPSDSLRMIGKAVGLSAVQVKNHVDDLREDGEVVTDGDTNRTIRYVITDAGRLTLERLNGFYRQDVKALLRHSTRG